MATSQADTPSSTIITRFKVPIMRAVVMPMVNLNKDKRSKRDIGKPALVTSANGNHVAGSCLTNLEKVLPLMSEPTPWL